MRARESVLFAGSHINPVLGASLFLQPCKGKLVIAEGGGNAGDGQRERDEWARNLALTLPSPSLLTCGCGQLSFCPNTTFPSNSLGHYFQNDQVTSFPSVPSV